MVGGRGRCREVGGQFARGKRWWLGGRVVVKGCSSLDNTTAFFLYCTQCKSKVLHFRRYNLPLLHTIIMVAKSLVRAFLSGNRVRGFVF